MRQQLEQLEGGRGRREANRCPATAGSGRGGRGRWAPRSAPPASAAACGRARLADELASAQQALKSPVRFVGARRQGARRCRGRAGARSRTLPAPRHFLDRLREQAAPACRERAPRKGARPPRRLCRRRGGARPRRRCGALRPARAPRRIPDARAGAQLLPAVEPVALRPSRPVHEHCSVAQQALRRRTRAHALTDREEAVEPLPPPPAARRLSSPSSGLGSRPAKPRKALGGDERREQDRHADDDERVGEVERRPEAEVEEVGHVPESQPVDQAPRGFRPRAGRGRREARDAAHPTARSRRASTGPPRRRGR